MKKALSVLLAAVCFLTVFAFSVNAQGETVRCSVLTETANFIFDGASGEITVTPAKLYRDKKGEAVYIAAVMGMCNDLHKPNNPIAAFATAFNIHCDYFDLVKETILDNVPSGSKLLIFGHSLGGMVAQQLLCDEDLTEAYEILGAVTIGSPYIMTKKSRREGTLTRFADVSDNVPKLSPALLFSRKNHKNAVFEDGGYDGNMDAAHNRSYRDAAVWDQYDALGNKKGGAYFTYNTADVIGIHS